MSGVTRSEFFQVEYVFDDTGRRVAEYCRNKDGQFDSPSDLPATTEFNRVTGAPQHLNWYRNGLLHRDKGKPASISFDASAGATVWEHYYERGALDPYLHPPTLGAVVVHKLYENGLLHSADGSITLVLRNPQGEVIRWERHRHGVLHHDNSPAVQIAPNGLKGPFEQQYWKNGVHLSTTIPKPILDRRTRR